MFTDFLNTTFGENNAFIALAVIAALLLLLFLFGRRRKKPLASDNVAGPRLDVVESAIIDEDRRMVLVRRDGVEHLLLTGGPNDLVIEQSIGATTKNDRVDDAVTRSVTPDKAGGELLATERGRLDPPVTKPVTPQPALTAAVPSPKVEPRIEPAPVHNAASVRREPEMGAGKAAGSSEDKPDVPNGSPSGTQAAGEAKPGLEDEMTILFDHMEKETPRR